MKVTRFLIVLALSVCATESQATVKAVTGNVDKIILADRGRFGSCMVRVTVRLADAGLDCPSKWVTFSCSGDFQEKDVAWRMFDSAQMAFSLNQKVRIAVDDSKKHNGYCFGNRIDVFP